MNSSKDAAIARFDDPKPVIPPHQLGMTVGIITFHASLNFGSALQAFALQSAVRELGHDSVIIDYRSENANKYKLVSLRHPKLTAKTLLHPKRYIARKRSFEQFAERWFTLSEKTYTTRNERELSELSDCCDAFICGSDQIWNLDCTFGVVEPFFLSFAGDRRRIAYAPSLAHTSFKSENFDKEKVGELLGRFDYISVRERETLPLFQPLVDKRIEVAIDPTLLIDANAYADMTRTCACEGRYIFVYLLRRSPELVESASEMSASTGARIVYISERDLPIANSVNLFGAGPEEFVSLIAHADAVLTNSFHATVFSILFHKPFRVFATDLSASRMNELTENLGIPKRCVSAVDASPLGDESWEEVDDRLDVLRKESWDFLKMALS